MLQKEQHCSANISVSFLTDSDWFLKWTIHSDTTVNDRIYFVFLICCQCYRGNPFTRECSIHPHCTQFTLCRHATPISHSIVCYYSKQGVHHHVCINSITTRTRGHGVTWGGFSIACLEKEYRPEWSIRRGRKSTSRWRVAQLLFGTISPETFEGIRLARRKHLPRRFTSRYPPHRLQILQIHICIGNVYIVSWMLYFTQYYSYNMVIL